MISNKNNEEDPNGKILDVCVSDLKTKYFYIIACQRLQRPNTVRAKVKTHGKHGGEEGRAERSRKSDAQGERKGGMEAAASQVGPPRAVRKVLGMEISVISPRQQRCHL